jgi:hypothetical protein
MFIYPLVLCNKNCILAEVDIMRVFKVNGFLSGITAIVVPCDYITINARCIVAKDTFERRTGSAGDKQHQLIRLYLSCALRL